MTIVNPLALTSPASSASKVSVATAEERQVGLRLDQIVRATVVEGGLDRVLLEVNQRHYQTQGELQLQVGQKLSLKVLQVHPKVEFQVLPGPLNGRLGQLLPLLSRGYDWNSLLTQLQQISPAQMPAELGQVVSRLQQILQPSSSGDLALQEQIGKLAGQLARLADVAVPGGAPAMPAAIPRAYQSAAGPPLGSSDWGVDLAGLLRDLQRQLQGTGRSLPAAWEAETRELLRPLLQATDQASGVSRQLPQQQGAAAQIFALRDVLQQLQRHPQAGPELAAALKSLQQRLPDGLAQAAPTAPLTESLAEAIPANDLVTGLMELVGQVKDLQARKQGLPPTLLGQLEGLLDRLRQVSLPGERFAPILPLLEQAAGQLVQLLEQATLRPEGKQLGLLSQLFGLHLEAELLSGRTKAALTSLKLGLLRLREELGEKIEEPLQRLELFQLSKARLAEEQLQFLPLPLADLEEGYLFADQPAESTAQGGEPPLQLSLALRLSALGNLRIDLLYDQQGMHLRLAGEDQEKMLYLQEHVAELKAGLTSVPLQGLNFAADAAHPLQQVLARLAPQSPGVLDDRI